MHRYFRLGMCLLFCSVFVASLIAGANSWTTVVLYSSMAFPVMAGLAVAGKGDRKDCVAADPDMHSVVLDNEYVRAWEALASPGVKSPMHFHQPYVLVSLSTARLKATLPDGTTEIVTLHPGQVVWLDNVEHSWEMLSGHGHVIGVEVKAARKS